MSAISNARLEDLRGVLLTWRLRLQQADEEVTQARKDHEYTSLYCMTAIEHLEAQLKDDRCRLDAACDIFFSPALSIEERQVAAAEFMRLQDGIRQAESDIRLLETESDNSQESLRKARTAHKTVRQEYRQALYRFVLAALNRSKVPGVKTFRKFLRAGKAGCKLKGENETAEIHIYCRYPGDLHYQQGHLVIKLNGEVHFIRRLREPRPAERYYRNRYEQLVYDMGAGLISNSLHPLLTAIYSSINPPLWCCHRSA